MNAEIEIRLKRLPHGAGLPLPAYATAHAAGMDVVAAEDVTLAPGARHAVAKGCAIAIPVGFEVQVRPRPGLELRHGVTFLNPPGPTDADYRGDAKGNRATLAGKPRDDRRGERIGTPDTEAVKQAVISPVDVLEETTRGAGC